MRNMTIVLTALLVALVPATSAQAALVLHWKLDDTGTTFKEEVSGNTTNAVAVNTVTTGQTALAPGGGSSIAVSETTPSSYIDAGTLQSGGTYVAGSDPDYKVLSGNYTVTAWANFDTYSRYGDHTIASSDWNSSNGWLFGVRSGGNLIFDFGNTRMTGSNISEDTDYLIAVMYDNTGSFGGQNNRIAVWDGSTWTNTDGTYNRSIRLQGLEIGAFNGSREMTGNIDDVRIYDHTLSLDELDDLAGAGGPIIPEPSTFAIWALGLLGLVLCGRRRRRAA